MQRNKISFKGQKIYIGIDVLSLIHICEFNVKVMYGPSNNEGYVYYFEKPLGWLEHYYLNPIPLNQLALNPALEQNPGWENNK